jgi:hypoxanthine phosphoribosyltransferase
VKFIAPSWDEILAKSIKLAQKIRKSERDQFDCIVGVSRGGLALTRILSDLLDIQNVMITRCEYYTDIGERRKKPVITQKPWCKITPDYFVAKTDAWIIFPWEYYEAIRSLSATNSKDVLSKTRIPQKYIDMLYQMDRSLRMRWKRSGQ